MNSFLLIEDYIFANDFLRFFDTSFKKALKVMFFEIWKNVNYVFSNTGCTSRLMFARRNYHNATERNNIATIQSRHMAVKKVRN